MLYGFLFWIIATLLILVLMPFGKKEKQTKTKTAQELADERRVELKHQYGGRKVLCRKQGELKVEETVYDDIFATADALGMSVEGVKYRAESEKSFKHKNEWYKLSFVL